MIHKSSRGQNVVFNFLGQIIPIAIGLLTVPVVIKGVGTESFGILSLAWILLGYFTVFDLGMGRATTKFIAESLSTGSNEDIRSIFWSSCLMNFFLGTIGFIIIAGFSSVLAENVFKISKDVVEVAKTSFIILAVSCPIVLVSIAFRGALEAAQQFKYINIVAVISSSLSFTLPIIGVMLNFDIRGILVLLVGAKLLSAAMYFVLCVKVFPVLKNGIILDKNRIRSMFMFGGWVSVSNVLNPVLTYLDRILIGSMLSIASVAYYTAPYEMISRLSIFPASLVMTLFPSFSAASLIERTKMTGLYARSVRLLLIIMAPIIMGLIVFAGYILNLWLGQIFAEKSTIVFQLLAVGVLINAMANIPFALIQGFGRPDITAKFHLLELVIYVPLVVVLIHIFGIAGGALAWTIRVSIDAVLLYTASRKYVYIGMLLYPRFMRIGWIILLLALSMGAIMLLKSNVIVKLILSMAAYGIYGVFSWLYGLNAEDRDILGAIINLNVVKSK